MTRVDSAARWVACPRCGRKSAFSPGNPWRPFCSERCKLTDLGDWASERYRIGTENDDAIAVIRPDDA